MRRHTENKLAVVAVILALVVACASVGRKEKALQVYQSIHAALATAQNAERVLCIPDATTPTHCTSKLAPTLGLTDVKHQQFNGQLSRAFALEIQVGTALKAWRAGDPPPAGLAELSAVASEILALASTLTNDHDVREILAAIKSALDIIAQLRAQVGG